jgi:hypothetical protein
VSPLVAETVLLLAEVAKQPVLKVAMIATTAKYKDFFIVLNVLIG